jgi:hypothetical protein
MFKEQMHRMNHRIDEASERWTKEKRALEIEIEEWRGKLAETCGKLIQEKIRQALK